MHTPTSKSNSLHTNAIGWMPAKTRCGIVGEERPNRTEHIGTPSITVAIRRLHSEPGDSSRAGERGRRRVSRIFPDRYYPCLDLTLLISCRTIRRTKGEFHR